MEVDLDHHGDREGPLRPGDLDLAVNVRLPGPPGWLRERLAASLTTLGAYPEPTAARAAVAARHGRPTDEVLLTNGAAEAFTLLARGLDPRRAVCVHPSFTLPEAALRAAGHAVERVLLPAPFQLEPALVPDDADLVVLGNPTNPTGVLHPRAAVEALVRPGRTVVVDEAFADAFPGEAESLAGEQRPGVVVVRSITKTWGLAGLRAGYLLAEPALVARLATVQGPWSVSSPALVALEATAAAEAPRLRGREQLVAALAEVGVQTLPGAAPFLLVRVDDALTVRARLAAQGLRVRRCDTFPGLDGDAWLRIAVVAPKYHARVVEAFRSVLQGAS